MRIKQRFGRLQPSADDANVREKAASGARSEFCLLLLFNGSMCTGTAVRFLDFFFDV